MSSVTEHFTSIKISMFFKKTHPVFSSYQYTCKFYALFLFSGPLILSIFAPCMHIPHNYWKLFQIPFRLLGLVCLVFCSVWGSFVCLFFLSQQQNSFLQPLPGAESNTNGFSCHFNGIRNICSFCIPRRVICKHSSWCWSESLLLSSFQYYSAGNT